MNHWNWSWKHTFCCRQQEFGCASHAWLNLQSLTMLDSFPSWMQVLSVYFMPIWLQLMPTKLLIEWCSKYNECLMKLQILFLWNITFSIWWMDFYHPSQSTLNWLFRNYLHALRCSIHTSMLDEFVFDTFGNKILKNAISWHQMKIVSYPLWLLQAQLESVKFFSKLCAFTI